jgi:hypothetical protein
LSVAGNESRVFLGSNLEIRCRREARRIVDGQKSFDKAAIGYLAKSLPPVASKNFLIPRQSFEFIRGRHGTPLATPMVGSNVFAGGVWQAIMPKCVHCGSETDLFISNVPVCVKCDSIRQKTTDLFKSEVRLNSARAKWRAAKLQFDEISASLPSNHLDGAQILKNASDDISNAAVEYNEALSEYSNATGKK